MHSQDTGVTDCSRYILQVYVGALSLHYEALSVEASKQTTAEEIVSCIVERLGLTGNNYELAEVAGECKERRLSSHEKPVSVMLLWPQHSDRDFHRFYLREIQSDVPWLDNYGLDPQILRDFIPFLLQKENREYPDLCQLPDLNESTLLENLRQRFEAGHIYTYVGSILIAVNPFKFHPIYNPKYVRLYQNQRIGPILPPHIFAIADNAYYNMLKEKRNQCVVISGESGSGKTESTNFLLHHLTALSQKGSHGSGVEQTILSAGPVLEAFGNAKTAHNNNSSRFGKFIQVNYRENGMVQGAVVQKYLLEKSRIVSQGYYERNYHVFYYLLSGATEQERVALHLLPAEKYHYLNAKNLTLENCDEKYEFSRLKQSMEMVGFSAEKQRRLFNVLSAVLLLGNVEFFPKKSTYHHDESVQVRNQDVVALISELLRVKQETLLAALTSKRVKASGETLIMQYKLPEAIAARDALAKCLYGALFDWIVLQVNHALLNKDQSHQHTGHSIGVLDIFGFEDFGLQNSFEQLCINYANEHLQYYFNLHVFKYEQKEYKREGIKWTDIEFLDNSGCLQLFESKPTGLLCILDDLCNFPGATNETLLQKFNSVHKDNQFYEKPQRKENAFIIKHYAGKVKYQVAEMREKNLDLMRQDIVSVLKNSSLAFVRELVGADPVAVFRWAILRAFFRGYFAFRSAGIKHRKERADQSLNKMASKSRYRAPNESIVSHLVTVSSVNLTINRIAKNKSFRPRERPKKGLKNLQSVKTLTAGQNLTNNQTAVKTRKQPLTVTAQFQNSLVALMETLNQANPFFIRCIKSNPNKIPNQFDDATVTRQLRYTGMLETVRIRRAGYNVRLTYEEFIQLYRILLPKGLVSSQKDVRDFMNTMDLNKQHYQLGITKIYMRESQKIRLDIALHTKIIDSIICIQRWFRSILQRRKYLMYRSAACTIQSYWRSHLSDKFTFKIRTEAAVVIQSAWRGYSVRKIYQKLKSGVIFVQARIRGNLARANFKIKKLRERAKLRTTQSLPVNERAIDVSSNEHHLISPAKKIVQHYSLDTAIDNVNKARLVATHEYDDDDDDDEEEEDEFYRDDSTNISVTSRFLDNCEPPHIQNLKINQSTQPYSGHQHFQNDFVDRPSRQQYNVDRAAKNYENTESLLRNYEQKVPVRRVDSGPSPMRRDLHRYDSLQTTSMTGSPTRNSNIPYSGSNIEVVYVSTGLEPTVSQAQPTSQPPTVTATVEQPKVPLQRNLNRNTLNLMSPINQSPMHRRDLGRSYGDEINSNYQQISSSTTSPTNAPHYQNMQFHNQNLSYSPTYTNNNVVKLCSSSSYNYNYNITSTQSQSKSQLSLQHQQPISGYVSSLSSTPKGKAASLLGAAHSEEAKSSKDIDLTLSSSQVQAPPVVTKTRRIKTNLSDDFTSSVANQSIGFHPASGLIRRGGVTKLGVDTLKRRNSDPTNKVPLLEVNRGNDMYQSSTRINIAGHQFRKVSRINKAEKCASCNESDSFVNEGYRCLDCKVLVHTKCIQNGGIKELQCAAKRSKRLRKTTDKSGASSTPNSKFQATREYTDSTDKIISDAKELQLMQDFITQKICKMESDCDSEVDRVFKQALREFKDNLVAQYSVAHKQNSEVLNIKYRDLIANFEQVIETASGNKNNFPLTMGVNAFRGFMNEFMNSREMEKPKAKRKKDKKRKHEDHTCFNGHTFQLTMINIPTACEICLTFLLWPIERGLVCQNCRLTCHKKCYLKAAACSKLSSSSANSSSGGFAGKLTKIFGVPLTALSAAEGGGVKIPGQIDQLMTKIEMLGLYAEGIYRKSGVTSKIKELKVKMDGAVLSNTDVDYESYNVHVLTSVLKSFLREMPEPLLTFDRYDDFLRAADLSDHNDRVQTLMSLIKKLPPAHHALLERIIFHLALVAQREQYNRMSASSLAIVFAPCVLRTSRFVVAQDSLNDIGRQTKCMETLITQKMLNVRSTLADIDTLDTAAHTATTRLSTLRSSKVFSPEELSTANRGSNMDSTETEEMLLEGHIQEIQKEKALLTSTLPSLARASSDDDLLSTDLDGEGGSLDDLSSGKDKDLDTTYTISDSNNSINNQDHSSNDVAMAVNYRDQSMDYYHKNKAKSLSQQTLSSDREAFLKSTTMPSSPNNSSQSGRSDHLSHSMITLSTNTTVSSSPSGGSCELQRQKPIIMRSISGGYESSSSSGSGSQQKILIQQTTSIPINASSANNNNKIRKTTKRPNNNGGGNDDEPIMV